MDICWPIRLNNVTEAGRWPSSAPSDAVATDRDHNRHFKDHTQAEGYPSKSRFRGDMLESSTLLPSLLLESRKDRICSDYATPGSANYAPLAHPPHARLRLGHNTATS